MLLIVAIGSIHAADDSDVKLTDSIDDDFDEDLELDDDDDDDFDDDYLDDDLDDDGDYDLDDYLDDDLDEDLDSDDLEDNLDEDDYLNDDLDYNYTDFDFLEFKIIAYLHQYGNISDYNWTESSEFLNEYQIYLSNQSNYILNESAEGYQTYLKIFDSITSTFNEYNLTENQTAYLKFMVIFYLNHYGNVSANYTWNESDNFSSFSPRMWDSELLGAIMPSLFKGYNDTISDFNNIFNPILANATDVNLTSNATVNKYDFDVPVSDSDWNGILILLLLIIMVFLVFI